MRYLCCFLFVALLATITTLVTTIVTAQTNTTTTTAVPTTVAAPVPSERPADEYLLVLTGTKEQWQKLIDNNKTTLSDSLRKDLASRFFTAEEFIRILTLIAGSLKVTFSVSPGLDGTQVNEGAFFDSASDSSWLKSTAAVFKTVSNSKLEVTSAGYSNASKTRPPKHIVCSDGCAGAVAAGGAVLFVACVLVLWAWRLWSKERDDMEIAKLENEGVGAGGLPGNEPVVDMDEMAGGGGVGDEELIMQQGSGIFSDRRGGRVMAQTPRE